MLNPPPLPIVFASPLQLRLGDCVTVSGSDYTDEEGQQVQHLLRITEIFYTIAVRGGVGVGGGV
jgi:hypothetical protein